VRLGCAGETYRVARGITLASSPIEKGEMSDSLPSSARVDRTALSVVPLFDNSDEKRYWRAQTGAERLAHVETLRRINYGSQATEGLQRVLEFAPVPWR
jgi:hypothetical protein